MSVSASICFNCIRSALPAPDAAPSNNQGVHHPEGNHGADERNRQDVAQMYASDALPGLLRRYFELLLRADALLQALAHREAPSI